ncbi:Glutathione peroxidase 2 [Coemansia helicoidea]|uniref:Glutathione peroxidase 2 n=1 Tax=Coemansia helicoidea TaxID=1286919 RepID=A0ACC1KUN2_9FUNG|nr:Glutathione peroxidase 2 [Coemansia helicoidea]
MADSTTPADAAQKQEQPSAPFYKLSAKTIGGEDYPFEQLRGKVVLIVNVASKCGFTPQYKALEELYEKHQADGLVVLGFPSNQFMSQEPGSAKEIQDFCRLTYGVTFPVMEKSDVNGDNANPVFKHIKAAKPGLLGLTRVKWNFEKFLVDRRGAVVGRWASTTDPKSIDAAIRQALGK